MLTIFILLVCFSLWQLSAARQLGEFCLLMGQCLVAWGTACAIFFIVGDCALAIASILGDWAHAYPTLAKGFGNWILLPCGVLLVPVLLGWKIRQVRHGAIIGAPDDCSDENILKRRYWAARAVARRERLRGRLPDWARCVFPSIPPQLLELTSDERIQAREKERQDALARWRKEAEERWPPPEWLRRDPPALSRLLEVERRHGSAP
jgi:hypothetical protein